MTDGHKCGRSGRQSGRQSAVGPSRNYQKFLILIPEKYIGPSSIIRFRVGGEMKKLTTTGGNI